MLCDCKLTVFTSSRHANRCRANRLVTASVEGNGARRRPLIHAMSKYKKANPDSCSCGNQASFSKALIDALLNAANATLFVNNLPCLLPGDACSVLMLHIFERWAKHSRKDPKAFINPGSGKRQSSLVPCIHHVVPVVKMSLKKRAKHVCFSRTLCQS